MSSYTKFEDENDLLDRTMAMSSHVQDSPDMKSFSGMSHRFVDNAMHASFSPSQFFGDGLSAISKLDSPRTPRSRQAPRRLAMESADSWDEANAKF